jgi:hypothetical protein
MCHRSHSRPRRRRSAGSAGKDTAAPTDAPPRTLITSNTDTPGRWTPSTAPVTTIPTQATT